MKLTFCLYAIFLTFNFALACSEDTASTGDSDTDSDSDSDSDIDAGEPIPFDLMCEAFIEDACNAILLCPDLGLHFDYKDEAHCRSDLPCWGYADLQHSEEQGWITYSPQAMGACHAQLRADPCGEANRMEGTNIQGVLLLCDDVVIAQQTEGETCIDYSDCQDGLYCRLTDSCPGECTLWAEQGEFCDEDAENFRCNPFNDLYCDDNVCTAYARLGDPCDDVDCDRGLICRPDEDDPFSSHCEDEVLEGEACTYGGECASGLDCVSDGEPDGMSYCTGPQPEGSQCDWDDNCEDGLACVDDICAQAPVAGEKCRSYMFGGDSCADGHICEDNVCLANRYPGESCTGELEICAESICVEGVCSARLADGETCESEYECQNRSCKDNVCRDPSTCEADLEPMFTIGPAN